MSHHLVRSGEQLQRVVDVFDIDVALISSDVETATRLWLKINHPEVFGYWVHSVNLVFASRRRPNVNFIARLLPWDPNVPALVVIIVIAFIIDVAEYISISRTCASLA